MVPGNPICVYFPVCFYLWQIKYTFQVILVGGAKVVVPLWRYEWIYAFSLMNARGVLITTHKLQCSWLDYFTIFNFS